MNLKNFIKEYKQDLLETSLFLLATTAVFVLLAEVVS